jgi:lipoprotein NlpI
MEHCRQTLRLRPDFPYAHNMLGMLLAQSGDLEAAIEHYRKALQLKPDMAEAQRNLESALRGLESRE